MRRSSSPTARPLVSEAAAVDETSIIMGDEAPQHQQQQRRRALAPLALLTLGGMALLLLPHAAQAYRAPSAARPQRSSGSSGSKPRLALRPLSTTMTTTAAHHPFMAAARGARLPPCFAHHHERSDGCGGCSSGAQQQVEEQQEQQKGSGGFLRRLPGRVLGKVWRPRRQQEEGVEEEKGASLSKLAGGLVLAAIGPNPWDRGMGINPTPPSALAIWGPYVFTLLFLTFGMRGLEPLKRFLYDRQKRRKQAKKNAAKPKKKAYYRQPSKLYAMAQKKLEQQQNAQAAQEADAPLGAEGADGAAAAAEEEEEEEVEEAEPALSAYRCEVCSFTIYPARGREFKFFPAGFKCPSCGATKEKFYDLTDPDDPRNQEGGETTQEAAEDLGDDDAFQLDNDEDTVPPLEEPGAAGGAGDGYPVEPSGALQ